MHKIILHRNAVKFYRKADDGLKERVADAIDIIARNPRLGGHIRKLKGDLKHMHRFRMGDLRIFTRSTMRKKLCGSRPSNGEDRHTSKGSSG